MSRTTQQMVRLREARESAGMDPPTCDNCTIVCSDRRLGHSPCTGWYGGPGTINEGPTEAEVFEREVERVAGVLRDFCIAAGPARDIARAVLKEIRR